MPSSVCSLSVSRSPAARVALYALLSLKEFLMAARYERRVCSRTFPHTPRKPSSLQCVSSHPSTYSSSSWFPMETWILTVVSRQSFPLTRTALKFISTTILCLPILQPTGAPRGRRNAPARSRQPHNGGGAGRGAANGATTAAARTSGVSL